MIEPYLVTYRVYVFAHNAAEADGLQQTLRVLSKALGHDPGAGQVKRLDEKALDRTIVEQLARARRVDAATGSQRARAVRGLASHLEGDHDFAEQLVDSIEKSHGGSLPRALAEGLDASLMAREKAA